MLNLVCDRSAVSVVELNIARNAFVLQMVFLIFFDRDVSAEYIWIGSIRTWRPNDLQVLEIRNGHLMSEKAMR